MALTRSSLRIPWQMRLLTLAMLLAVCAGFNQAPQVPRSAVQLRRSALHVFTKVAHSR